ncbi:MAG: TatD family hydrolase [Planctomycetaceae bacterium]|nr:TatD family hydrolase [Planctomycetaceae bacterium]
MTNLSLTDMHCHLQDSRFDGDVDAVVVRARRVGVERFLCNASMPSDWEKTRSLAERLAGIIPCLGLHPLYVAQIGQNPDWLDRLAELLAKPFTAENTGNGKAKKCFLPVGEIGLDHYVEPRDDALQETVFREQLRLASRLQRPVMLHTRHSLDRVVEILALEKGDIPVFLLHGFGSPAERVRQIVSLGGYFSFSANLLKTHHKKTRAAAIAVPLDRILLESDAPDMPPPMSAVPEDWPTQNASHAPVRCEPSILPSILAELAALRQMSIETFAETIRNNEITFFQKAGLFFSATDQHG